MSVVVVVVDDDQCGCLPAYPRTNERPGIPKGAAAGSGTADNVTLFRVSEESDSGMGSDAHTHSHAHIPHCLSTSSSSTCR